MANTINKEEPYKLVEALIEALEETSLTDPNKEFHQLYVTISSEFQNIDKVDYIAHIIYDLPRKKFESLQDIFGIGKTEEDLFSDFVNEIKEKQIKGRDNEEFNAKFSDKIVEHIRLCCFQRSFMEKNAEKALKISNEANDLADTAAKSAKDTKEIKDKIYTDFIAILGIFTAVSFLAMGSLQVLGDLFKGVGDPSTDKFGYSLVIGGIYILIIYVFLITMFIGMGKVIGNKEPYKFTWGFCLFILIVCSLLISIGLFVLNYILPGIIILTGGMTGLAVILIKALEK